MSARPVIAIAANPALDQAIQAFLAALKHNGKGAEAYIELMARITDRMIGLFMLEPVEIAKISPAQRKIVDFAVDTGSKASSMLTAQIYRKTTNAQFAPIARDLEKMYWPAGADNGNVPQLYYTPDAMFARNYQLVIDACANGHGRAHMELVLQVLNRMVDDVLQTFFLAQTRHVEIGFITRKALDVSVAATRAACHAVMSKVVKDFSDEQLKDFMSHYAQVLKQKA
ncbi:MAG: hypothetical protein ACOY33_05465 [Pseudomonadota bacterium]